MLTCVFMGNVVGLDIDSCIKSHEYQTTFLSHPEQTWVVTGSSTAGQALESALDFRPISDARRKQLGFRSRGSPYGIKQTMEFCGDSGAGGSNKGSEEKVRCSTYVLCEVSHLDNLLYQS